MKTWVSAFKAGFMIALIGIFIAGCSGGGGGGSSSPTGTGTNTGTNTDTDPGTGAPTIAGTVYPTVVSKSTDGSSCAVDSGAVISVTFNKDMNASTITAANFTVSGANGAVAYDPSAKKATFTPSSALAYDTAYTATITTSVKDAAGNAMANNYSWSFTTRQNPATAAYATFYLMGGAMQGNPLSPFARIVTTIAGTGLGSTDGTGLAASFGNRNGITTDGTNLYVADSYNNTIRKIVISTGVVTRIAGTGSPGSTNGPGLDASFYNPNGITTDGTNLYVADTNYSTVRKIVISTGVVTTLAGTAGPPGSADGTGPAASFGNPYGITTDGTNLYVADTNNHTVRRIVISTGVVTTIAGTAGSAGSTDGTGPAARFGNPHGITTDGTNLYVADTNNNAIRRIVISTGVVTTIAGTAGSAGATDGTGPAASFGNPHGITTDGTNLYVADTNNRTIRKIVISTGVVTTIAGTAGFSDTRDGTGLAARFSNPKGITTDGTSLYVADTVTIRKISAVTTAPSSSPANMIASAGNGQITITWDGVSGANCYNLYCAAGTSVTETAGTAIASVASPYTYTGLTNGTTYACIATAVNNIGEGPASSPIPAITPAASYTLSVSKDGTGSGTVSSSPSGIDCGSTCSASVTIDTAVTLTAIAASGSTFSGWGGVCSGTGSCTAMMDSDKTVTVTFTASTPPPPPPPPTTGGTYYWANWSCGSSSQCASVMGASSGSTGLFCTVNDCNAWKSINFAGASCSTTATYAKRESTGSNGLCNQSGVDF